jgi:hypothetical protein
MTIRQLARIFLRFHGLLFLGTMIYECMNITRDYRTFVTDVLAPENVGYGKDIFWLGIFRTAVYALSAFVLLLKTDRVILLLGGKAEPHDKSA